MDNSSFLLWMAFNEKFQRNNLKINSGIHKEIKLNSDNFLLFFKLPDTHFTVFTSVERLPKGIIYPGNISQPCLE